MLWRLLPREAPIDVLVGDVTPSFAAGDPCEVCVLRDRWTRSGVRSGVLYCQAPRETEVEWADPVGLSAIRAAVDALLSDARGIAAMTPLQHLAWARTLPLATPVLPLPAVLADAVDMDSHLGPAGLAAHRRDAIAFWEKRGRVTGLWWAAMFRRLPEHVQSVLGPGKDLLLFKARLRAARLWLGGAAARSSGDVRRGRRGRPRSAAGSAGRLPACGMRARSAGGCWLRGALAREPGRHVTFLC